MTKWERLQQQLERILEVSLRLVHLSASEWTARFGSPGIRKKHQESDGFLYLYLETRDDQVTALEIPAHALTETERALVDMHVEAIGRTDRRKSAQTAEAEEDRSVRLSHWLGRQLELGLWNEELPEPLSGGLRHTLIPILLYADRKDRGADSFADTKRLFESFFEEQIVLIPLMEREWVILASERILSAEVLEDKGGDGGETIEESLESMCLGLYEMVATEGFGECRLSVDYPLVPAKHLVGSVQRMREAIQLGRTYRVAANVHPPWTLQLERLLHPVPAQEKAKFLERILKRADHVLDQEMLSTLEQFFALGCNVSETAKMLYIHRNTLLYRLDKFKQETGLDVRSFNDAVLVKIALLLYKVTKRM